MIAPLYFIAAGIFAVASILATNNFVAYVNYLVCFLLFGMAVGTLLSGINS